ncbi:hypothetical protein BDW74DRAFT_180377 [Aspergillus multicolor]|uniref:uncharacterized protein n=1 Tax=Aspergillus multicolor TaxID=41759 RepID=UPI003CCCC091
MSSTNHHTNNTPIQMRLSTLITPNSRPISPFELPSASAWHPLPTLQTSLSTRTPNHDPRPQVAGLAVSPIGQHMFFTTGPLIRLVDISSLTRIEPTLSHPVSSFQSVKPRDLETCTFDNAAAVVPPVIGGIGIGVWWSDLAAGDLLWGVGRVVGVGGVRVPIVEFEEENPDEEESDDEPEEGEIRESWGDIDRPETVEAKVEVKMDFSLTEEDVECLYAYGDGDAQLDMYYGQDELNGAIPSLGFR